MHEVLTRRRQHVERNALLIYRNETRINAMDANQAVAYVAYRLSEGCGPCRATTDVATADNMQNPLELRTAKV